MYPVELQMTKDALAFNDPGGCSIGWMRGFPYDTYIDPKVVSPEAFAKAEAGPSPVYGAGGMRKAWLASIMVPQQSKVREALTAAGYQLLGTSGQAHNAEGHMELWGKGFTLPVVKPVERLKRRVRAFARHKRAPLGA